MRGKHAGQRGFIVGSGPSIVRTPLHLLEGEYAMCFNRFHLYFERTSWRPNMYMVVDEAIAQDTADEINDLVPMFDYAFFPAVHPSGVDFRDYVTDADNIWWMDLQWGGTHVPPRVGLGGTAAHAALQVMMYMGFSPIYLVGIDMDWQHHETLIQHDERNLTSTADDDPNHFDPRYYGAGKKHHAPKVEEACVPSFTRTKAVADTVGIEVVNATVGGKLEVFPRVEYRSLFDYTAEQERAMVEKASGPLWEGPVVTGLDAFDSSANAFTAPLDVAEALIGEAIFTHVPYGPFDDTYFFAKREVPLERTV